VSFLKQLAGKFLSEDRLEGTKAYLKADLPGLTPHGLFQTVS